MVCSVKCISNHSMTWSTISIQRHSIDKPNVAKMRASFPSHQENFQAGSSNAPLPGEPQVSLGKQQLVGALHLLLHWVKNSKFAFCDIFHHGGTIQRLWEFEMGQSAARQRNELRRSLVTFMCTKWSIKFAHRMQLKQTTRYWSPVSIALCRASL